MSERNGGDMALKGRLFPCHSREAVVMVRSYKNGVMDGWLQHPRLNQKEELRSTAQMILLLNDLLELENCPNSPLPLVHSECDSLEQLTVFRIQILFREHYTWQGKLIWLNENQEIVFHSAIELLLLLDEILAE
jgi:hypothetical protein